MVHSVNYNLLLMFVGSRSQGANQFNNLQAARHISAVQHVVDGLSGEKMQLSKNPWSAARMVNPTLVSCCLSKDIVDIQSVSSHRVS